MGTLFRLGRDAVTPAAGTRVLKASEASLLLEAQTLLDAARERAAEMDREAQAAYERRREEGYRDGQEEGRLEHAEKVLETVLSSVEYIEGIESTLVRVVSEAIRKVIGEVDENERIVRIVRNALTTVRNQQRVLIRVAPADEKPVREALAAMLTAVPGSTSFVDVVGDARLERGACLLESELGVVDASLETQLKALENAFRAKIAS
ncbi:MAG TPA: HrpE/YscL family type III secretion apparatus protein [Candidatus Bilophila faecipullorum]|uniref:Type 3 secretion system stator protein n=1 Tax=Candidatus Bilophila faecipullorum TaxID=2838482 RepID=A0A9D1U8U6_9BACT|nr:HrpE/YscL family type III secretion apparatus protein [uncultured Bilophila sp.]HIW77806.1 HrpE/YscL family type III secretion apparatus protein [Candidatus Bilophila faecipullorum]